MDRRRQALRAGLAALDGEVEEAGRQFSLVLEALRDLGLPFVAATMTITMATLLGPDHAEVQTEVEAARETLGQLGATPFLARLEAAISRQSPSRREAGQESVRHTPAHATQARP
jgi:hypothetical protein